jgi:hypothetical protein
MPLGTEWKLLLLIGAILTCLRTHSVGIPSPFDNLNNDRKFLGTFMAELEAQFAGFCSRN